VTKRDSRGYWVWVEELNGEKGDALEERQRCRSTLNSVWPYACGEMNRGEGTAGKRCAVAYRAIRVATARPGRREASSKVTMGGNWNEVIGLNRGQPDAPVPTLRKVGD